MRALPPKSRDTRPIRKCCCYTHVPRWYEEIALIPHIWSPNTTTHEKRTSEDVCSAKSVSPPSLAPKLTPDKHDRMPAASTAPRSTESPNPPTRPQSPDSVRTLGPVVAQRDRDGIRADASSGAPSTSPSASISSPIEHHVRERDIGRGSVPTRVREERGPPPEVDDNVGVACCLAHISRTSFLSTAFCARTSCVLLCAWQSSALS